MPAQPKRPRPGREIAYLSIAADLRNDIATGRLGSDRRLPTERQLIERYGVSRQTVRRALQELHSEGLIFRVRGRGTFPLRLAGAGHYLQSVASIDELFAMSIDTELETLEPLTRHIDVEGASRLRLVSDDVFAGLFRRLHEGAPFCVMRVLMPPEIGRKVLERDALPGLHETRPDTIISVVDDVSREPLMAAHQSITAGRVPPGLGATIDLADGDWALRVDRLYLDGTGRPALLGVSHYHPRRYTYRLALRRKAPPDTSGG
jgi:GntR family transcriptional regulator